MNKSEFLKHLRGLVSEGRTEEALDFLSTNIKDFATYFSNDVVMLKNQFLSAKNQFLLKGIIENAEFGRITARVSLAILEIADKVEKRADVLDIQRRGHLLHKIPSIMVKDKETKCIIRIAYLYEHLLIGLTVDEDTIFHTIQVTGLMSVELIDDNEIKTFEIRTSTDEEQFIIHEECTQWIFKVKPLRIGYFPLLLKIGAVEVINGREIKRNIIIEKEIQIAIESREIGEVGFSLINFESAYFFGILTREKLRKSQELKELERLEKESLAKYEEELKKKRIEEEENREKIQNEKAVKERMERTFPHSYPPIHRFPERQSSNSYCLGIITVIIIILIVVYLFSRG